jgi:ABC-type glutathione transport system ATPase component
LTIIRWNLVITLSQPAHPHDFSGSVDIAQPAPAYFADPGLPAAIKHGAGAGRAPQADYRNPAHGWLLPDHESYYPHMLAPGQKQRLGLARALILRPKVIIADEALASLDMSMRSQLINLMLELQEKQGISYIYVTQHLGMMKHISDQVLVMHQGEVVERGSTADVMASPLHELTKRLIAGHFGEALTADAWRKDR